MFELNYINIVIAENINNGIYSVEIDLSEYDPGSSASIALVTIPPDLEKISFVSGNPSAQYYFRIVANEERHKDIEVRIENLYLNAGENIGIDLRALKDQDYKNTILYKGSNTVTSSKSIGILVTNNQTMYITGEDSSSTLNVKGGIQNCAIGNSPIINLGGKIIFSGTGTVDAAGGNGSAPDQPSLSIPLDGAYGIGFAHNTEGSSSITILCSVQVETAGGEGQKCDSDDPNSHHGSGNGGAGISLGADGILYIEECSEVEKSLKAYGGNGGEIYGSGDIQNVRKGGDGGDAISIVSGTVNILGGAELTGGDGTTISNGDESLPLQGGDGGSAAAFTGDSDKKNNIILGDNADASGGNGGDSGVSLDFDTDFHIDAMDGGKGGTVIETGSSPVTIVLGNGSFSSGDGGSGGSTDVYGDDIIGIQGADFPGSGGDNGSIIQGTGQADITKNPGAEFIDGTPGKCGTGMDADGNTVEGTDGNLSVPMDIPENEKFEFGYINLKVMLNLENNVVNTDEQSGISEEGDTQLICINKTVYISQTFENCLSIYDTDIQQRYNSENPGVITGNVNMMLLIKSSIAAYEKKGLPLFAKL